MTMMSDLPQDLVAQILSRVPITCMKAVRSTSKRWNGILKDPRFRKKHCGKAAKDFLVIMVDDCRVCLMSVNLNGINNHKDLFDPSIKQIGEFNQVKITKVFQYCNGLLLCLTAECNTRLVVWNLYLGQTRWIKPTTTYRQSDMFVIGYDDNNNHKILRRFHELDYIIKYEIYDFKTNAWKVLTTSYFIVSYRQGVSLKGNSYFLARKKDKVKEDDDNNDFLLCFDFTRERFGPLLHLPFHCYSILCDDIVLSTVREEQLAVLLKSKSRNEMEIWITTKVEPNVVSWNNFLAVDMDTITSLYFEVEPTSFLVDEEKKVAVICFIQTIEQNRKDFYEKACIIEIGKDGYINEVDLGGSRYSCPLVCSVMFQV